MRSHKPRILFLVLEMDLGGLQRIVYQLINGIDKERFIPYLCCLDRGGIFYEQLALHSIKTYILERKPGPFDIRLFIKLCQILSKERIDVIHSQNGCTLYAALAGRLAGVSGIVHTDHGRLVPDKRSAIWEDRISSYMIDHFIGVSDNLSDYLSSAVKINRKKLITIINGVDTSRFVPVDPERKQALRSTIGLTEADKVIGTVCRLDPIKNLDFLLKCFPAIVSLVPNAMIVIAGDGPNRDHLIKHAETLGISSRVIFLGRSSNVENIMPMFDIYACTSLSEGTSMTILEAMSCGLPVIASDVGGNSRLVDSSNGYLFPLNDEALFTNNIIALLNDKAVLNELGSQSRIKVQKEFSIDQMIESYQRLYESVISRDNGKQ
ncbi:MAG: glycosyltransferase [Nitrospirota bacterium]